MLCNDITSGASGAAPTRIRAAAGGRGVFRAADAGPAPSSDWPRFRPTSDVITTLGISRTVVIQLTPQTQCTR